LVSFFVIEIKKQNLTQLLKVKMKA